MSVLGVRPTVKFCRCDLIDVTIRHHVRHIVFKMTGIPGTLALINAGTETNGNLTLP